MLSEHAPFTLGDSAFAVGFSGAMWLLFFQVPPDWEAVAFIPRLLLSVLALWFYLRFAFAIDSLLLRRDFIRRQLTSRNAFVVTMCLIAGVAAFFDREAGILVAVPLVIIAVHRVGAASICCPICGHPASVHESEKYGVVVCSAKATIREFGFSPRVGSMTCPCKAEVREETSQPDSSTIEREG